MAELYSSVCVCVCVRQFLYSFIHRWTRLFPCLCYYRMMQWIWTCNEYEHLFKLVFSLSSDKYSEVKLLNYMVILFLIFWAIFTLFSIVTAPINILTNNAHPCQHLLFIVTLTNVKWCLIMILIFISLWLVWC